MFRCTSSCDDDAATILPVEAEDEDEEPSLGLCMKTFSAVVAAARQGRLPSNSPTATRPGRTFCWRFRVNTGLNMVSSHKELPVQCAVPVPGIPFSKARGGMRIPLSGWREQKEGGGKGLTECKDTGEGSMMAGQLDKYCWRRCFCRFFFLFYMDAQKSIFYVCCCLP